jgi:hypothetical protein
LKELIEPRREVIARVMKNTGKKCPETIAMASPIRKIPPLIPLVTVRAGLRRQYMGYLLVKLIYINP